MIWASIVENTRKQYLNLDTDHYLPTDVVASYPLIRLREFQASKIHHKKRWIQGRRRSFNVSLWYYYTYIIRVYEFNNSVSAYSVLQVPMQQHWCMSFTVVAGFAQRPYWNLSRPIFGEDIRGLTAIKLFRFRYFFLGYPLSWSLSALI